MDSPVDHTKTIVGLCRAGASQTFLSGLQANYTELGIGVNLDFTEVAEYWLAGTPLSGAWRRSLALNLCRRDTDNPVWWPELYCQNLHVWALREVPPERWQDVAERCVLLLSPFMHPRFLRHWLLPLAGAVRPELKLRSWAESQLSALTHWAKALASAPEWTPVREWLIAAGSEPGLLLASLQQKVRQPWRESDLSGLATLRLWLTLVREQLQLEHGDSEVMMDLLWLRPSLAQSTEDLVGLESLLSLRQNYLQPMLRLILAQPELGEWLDQIGEGRTQWLFETLGLGLLLAQTPEAYRQLLNQVSDNTLAKMGWPKNGFGRFSEVALLRQQQVFERCAVLLTEAITPEALEWYRQVAQRLPIDSPQLNRCLVLLLEHGSDDAQLALIERFVVPVLARGAQVPKQLFDRITHRDYLLQCLASDNPSLSMTAARRLFELTGVEQREGSDTQASFVRDPQHWSALLDVCSRFPEAFIHTVCASHLRSGRDSLERWRQLWHATQGEALRYEIAKECFLALGHEGQWDQLFAFAEPLFASEPEIFQSAVGGLFSYHLWPAMMALTKGDSSLRALLPLMAARYLEMLSLSPRSAAREMRAVRVSNALVRFPLAYAELHSNRQLLLLPLFDSAALVACSATLSRVMASTTKSVRDPSVAMLARCSAEAVERSGLLQASTKVRNHVLRGIALSTEPAMSRLVLSHFADSAHDDVSRSLSLDALERAGQDLTGLDPWARIDLGRLQAIAEEQGPAIAPVVRQVWSGELAELFAPLGEGLGLYLLSLFHTREDLCRQARQILALLHPMQRSELALSGLNQWIANGGVNEFAWLLRPLAEYGDERAANALVKAVKDWKKFRTAKSAQAIGLLCLLPGNFGPNQACDLLDNGKLPRSIKDSAVQGLSEAAERRDLSFDEFKETLAPDFGMSSEGLLLDLGPYSCRVCIRPDLSLAVFDQSGKLSKSLPKARAVEDAGKRSLAEVQFKALSKNLKPFLKQQHTRLGRALQLGKRWSTGTWQQLYGAHPLLKQIAQAVIWSIEDDDGRPIKRFRPTDGGELIGLDDEPYELPQEGTVHVAHPLELDEAERAAWRQHFVDYRLESPLNQLDIPVYLPANADLAASGLDLASDCVVSRGTFGSLVDKWGYRKGDAEDGGVITEHNWQLDDEGWQVTIEHGDIQLGYFDADDLIDIGKMVVYRQMGGGLQALTLNELPRAFANTLLTQLHSLQEASA